MAKKSKAIYSLTVSKNASNPLRLDFLDQVECILAAVELERKGYTVDRPLGGTAIYKTSDEAVALVELFLK